MAKSKNGRANREYREQQAQAAKQAHVQRAARVRRSLSFAAFLLSLMLLCGAVTAIGLRDRNSQQETLAASISNAETSAQSSVKPVSISSAASSKGGGKIYGMNSTGGSHDRVTYSDGDVEIVAAGLLKVGYVLQDTNGKSQTVVKVEPESPDGRKPIEKITVGEMVNSLPDPAALSPNSGDKTVDGEDVNAKTWRELDLVMGKGSGKTEIHLLRPLWWIEKVGAKKGKTIHLDIPEMGKSGPTYILAVKSLPEGETYGEGTVTGTFKHTATNVLSLQLEGEPKPIGVTASHPFRSTDRKEWVPAGALKVGERVVTRKGTTKVVSVEKRSGKVPVYNLEVHKLHTFFVGKSAAWVHNTCPGAFNAEDVALGVHEHLPVFKGNAKIGTDFPTPNGLWEGIKAGIDQTVAAGGKIRFNLDGIRISDAMNPNSTALVPGTNTRIYDTITSQELRYVMQNHRGSTVFYRNGEIVTL